MKLERRLQICDTTQRGGAATKTEPQPQRVAIGITSVLRLVLRTQPRSRKFARSATIWTDTDRVQLARLSTYARRPYLILVMALVLLTGCTTTPPRVSAPSPSEQVKQRLAEVFHAAETKDLPRLDSYHWYGPQFTKFAGTGRLLDAAAAREGEHKGLSGLAGLRLRADDLQVEVFDDAAVATFTMVATIQSGAEAITKRERGTLVFVKHEGSWKIVHEHFSAAE
jgi:hypothetical protein